MDNLGDILGIKVTYKTWELQKKLPYFMGDMYKFRAVYLEGIKAIFLYPIAELDPIGSIKKQILKIQKLENIPVVLVLQTITRQRRQYLLKSHIPFVVEGRQIFLPFLEIALQERFDVEVKQIEKLQPSSQVLLLYYIYKNQGRMYTNDAVKALGVSAMTITRVFRQLEMTKIFRVEKKGAQNILLSDLKGQEIFEKAMPFLTSPIRETMYIDANAISQEMLLSGDFALAKKSMLNFPTTKCYAINAKAVKERRGTKQLLDRDRQIQLELWKYAPQLLTNDEAVDTLSLALSMMGSEDERVEEAIDEMLNTLWRKLDDK